MVIVDRNIPPLQTHQEQETEGEVLSDPETSTR